jgi:hypothetical protein
MESTAGSSSDPVLDLEALRQQVEAAEHRIAGKAEFLEQYGGSPAERVQALQSMARDRERRDAYAARLGELIASLRARDSDAVHRWAERHRLMLSRVVAERGESSDGAARRAAAERTMRDWDDVETGQGRCVCLNRHLLADCVREASGWLRAGSRV